jgi:hypothetical protein
MKSANKNIYIRTYGCAVISVDDVFSVVCNSIFNES